MNSDSSSIEKYWCAGMPMTGERKLSEAEVAELQDEFDRLTKQVVPRGIWFVVGMISMFAVPTLVGPLFGKQFADSIGFPWLAPPAYFLGCWAGLSLRHLLQWRVWIQHDIKINRVGIFEGTVNRQSVTAEVMLGTARVWRLDGFRVPDRVTTVIAAENSEEFRKKGQAPILNALSRPIPEGAVVEGESLVLTAEDGWEIRGRMGTIMKAAMQPLWEQLMIISVLAGVWVVLDYKQHGLPALAIWVIVGLWCICKAILNLKPELRRVRMDIGSLRAARDSDRPGVVVLAGSRLRWTVEGTAAAWRG